MIPITDNYISDFGNPAMHSEHGISWYALCCSIQIQYEQESVVYMHCITLITAAGHKNARCIVTTKSKHKQIIGDQSYVLNLCEGAIWDSISNGASSLQMFSKCPSELSIQLYFIQNQC